MVACSSGTAAISAAILAAFGTAKPSGIALLPAYTFIGTAAAAAMCGMEPRLVDIDRDTGMLEPQHIASQQLQGVKVIIPVGIYGKLPDLTAWASFEKSTGVKVVIDGAACLERLVGCTLPEHFPPMALSFHATKSFGCGEGGAIVMPDPELALEAIRAINFGFLSERVARSPSMNAKMSEYHAAVCLAELDGWPEKLAAFRQVHLKYDAAQGSSSSTDAWNEGTASCYRLFKAAIAEHAQSCQKALLEAGVEYRMWYGRGLKHQAPWLNCSDDDFHNAAHLGDCLIGLPMACDMTDEQVLRVTSALNRAECRA